MRIGLTLSRLALTSFRGVLRITLLFAQMFGNSFKGAAIVVAFWRYLILRSTLTRGTVLGRIGIRMFLRKIVPVRLRLAARAAVGL